MKATHYDTVTKPALRALSVAACTYSRRFPLLRAAPLPAIKGAIDAAAKAGATRNELIEAVGGVALWNGLVLAIRLAS